MRVRLAAWLIGLGWVGIAGLAAAGCPPGGWDEAGLARLREARFELPDPASRETLARALLDCLADPRPRLRDDIAFEALSTWMRAGLLSVAQLEWMRTALTPRLTAEDPTGFSRPFAALTLAEIARVDRISPFLSSPDRDALLQAAVSYERGIRDFRGFDTVQGWRHGVAHGADLLLQLALNPALGREALGAIVAAVAVQVAPAGEHAFVFGESGRLARPVFHAARRGLHDSAYWSEWLAAVASPAPWPDWDSALKTSAGLARRHNTQAFVLELYVMVRESGDDSLRRRLLPGLQAALKALP
jgi:Protein of unknown function (DUF2785)